MGPSPKATSVDKTNEPETFPATVNTATLRPHEIARAMVKSTEGPGAMMIAMATITNSPILEGIGMPTNTTEA